MKLKQLIFLVLGCTCLVLGCIGIVLPILPTVPFFLVTVFCFANSSQKLHNWFVGTKMYKKHLESFVKKKGMTIKTKFGILIPVTIVMGIGFFLMMRGGILVPSVILAIVWVCHIIYFGFGVKTLSTADAEKYMRLAERYPFQKNIPYRRGKRQDRRTGVREGICPRRIHGGCGGFKSKSSGRLSLSK